MLRRWREDDYEPFARMCADPLVMEFFPKTLTTIESIDMAKKIEALFGTQGFGLWAIEVESGEFIGFVGLHIPAFTAHFTPCVEIGWRIAPKYWGQGIAVEAAKAALEDGFERIGLEEIVSFTAKLNHKSIRVMQKLGMATDSQDDFDHPNLPDSHILKPHVLYRLHRKHWLSLRNGTTV